MRRPFASLAGEGKCWELCRPAERNMAGVSSVNISIVYFTPYARRR
jgi:hypothetical protein